MVTLCQLPVLEVCAQGWSLAQLAHAGDVVYLHGHLAASCTANNKPESFVSICDELVSAHTAQGNTCVNEMVADPTISGDCVANKIMSCEGFNVKNQA